MFYSETIKQAALIAYDAHAGQYDKSGMPYIMHPIHVAEQMSNEETCCCALLHDVLEDCPQYTSEVLLKKGIPANVVEALQLLTHHKGTSYRDYVVNLAGNHIARAVKIADLEHNMDTSRLFNRDLTDKDRYRTAKYADARAFLILVSCYYHNGNDEPITEAINTLHY